MRTVRMHLLCLVPVAMVLLAAGCDYDYKINYELDNHYIDLYINDSGKTTALDGDTAIGNVPVFWGDVVVLNNLATSEVVVTFPEGIFEKGTVTIPAGKRAILKVVKEGSASFTMSVKIRDELIDGTPKVIVSPVP